MLSLTFWRISKDSFGKFDDHVVVFSKESEICLRRKADSASENHASRLVGQKVGNWRCIIAVLVVCSAAGELAPLSGMVTDLQWWAKLQL